MIGLCDANSFFASCERVFRPDLKESPIVVLSNNDGIIVAADKKAKSMGFKRGKAWFEVEKDAEEKGVYAFSSNYTLYQDMSNRVMKILESECPNIEQYSIDEAFIYPPKGMDPKVLRERVTKGTGIPTSIGFAKTKTLSKIANKVAKERKDGAFLLDDSNSDDVLKAFPIENVWGIGWSWSKELPKKGIRTAKDLRDADDEYISRHYPITLMRTVYELRGIEACSESDQRISFCSGISFKDGVSSIKEMEERLSIQAESLSRKLVENGYLASSFGLSFFTSRFTDSFDSPYASIRLKNATNYIPAFIEAIETITPRIFNDAFNYRGCRVFAFDLVKENDREMLLFDDNERIKKEEAMSHTVEKISKKYGRGAIHTAKAGNRLKEDLMKRERKSQNYTTNFNELPSVY